ncbi:LysR family transcriptional regulator [Roseobacter sp. A03A-229]
MDTLNYHHLRYFREVAHDGNLTRTAARVNLSQSALSTQIRTLEDRLGHALFDRVGRQLVLTEVGRIALDHADRIFGTGQELLDTLQQTGGTVPPLRVGALSTLSRNFQLRFLRPVLGQPDMRIILKSGSDSVLFDGLKSLALDVVLTTEVPHSTFGADMTAQRIADQPVALHGAPERMAHSTLREMLVAELIILPTDNAIRSGFDGLIARLGITPRVVAEVDDMAMVRLLARDNAGLAIAPSVVLADEIASGRLQTAPFDLGIMESFYAVTVQRSFPHPVLKTLLAAEPEPDM